MNLQEEISRIKSVMGILNEQTNVISNYVTDSNLIKILEDIEVQFNEKFTDDHFTREIGMSGNIKKEAGKILPEVITSFENMKKLLS